MQVLLITLLKLEPFRQTPLRLLPMHLLWVMVLFELERVRETPFLLFPLKVLFAMML